MGWFQPAKHLQTEPQTPGCQPARIILVYEGNVRDVQESLSHHYQGHCCSSLRRCASGLSLGGVMRSLLVRSVPWESVNNGGHDDREGRGWRWREIRRTNINRDAEAGDGCSGEKCCWQFSQPVLVWFSFYPHLMVCFPPEWVIERTSGFL